MEKVSRNVVIKSLDYDWDEYIDQLIRFSPAEKREFLQKQGFDTMIDFVAHIVGWWQECMRIIRVVQQNPACKPDEENVDQYNQKVIEENRYKSEEEIIGLFKDVKSMIREMIEELPNSAIENETINNYMFWCITNHVEEHKII
jgi:hypothetical protein